MKKYAAGIVALVVALGLSAFSDKHETKRGNDPYPYYFSYDGNTVAGESNVSNYTWLPGGPSVECEEGDDLHCVINANKDGSDQPILVSGGLPAFVEISKKAMQ